MLSTLYVNIRYFESLSKLAAHAIQIVQQSMLILNFQETSLRNPGKNIILISINDAVCSYKASYTK